MRNTWQEFCTEEEYNAIMKEKIKKEFNCQRNIKRDEKGRLNKGAKLAKKDDTDDIIIWLRLGWPVKQIVETLGFSKSTVYRIKKQYEKFKRWEKWMEQ